MSPIEENQPNILLLGSDVKANNLPIKEVSLLSEGSLPAYGCNSCGFWLWPAIKSGPAP